MDSTRATLAALTDDELELRLFDLGQHVAWPPTPDLDAAFTPTQQVGIRRFGERRLWLAAAVVLVMLGAALALSQGFRDTVAGVFGVRGVDIVIQRDDPTPSPSGESGGINLAIGQPVSMSEATEAIPFQITLPELLGDPGGLYVRELPAGNLMLSASYAPGPDLPEAAETGVGLLLMQFTSSSGAPSLIKGVTEDYSTLAEVEINGQPGFWVEGASQLTIVSDPSVGWEESVTRPSANVLLWQENGVTYRMESALSLLDAVQIAESMQPVE